MGIGDSVHSTVAPSRLPSPARAQARGKVAEFPYKPPVITPSLSHIHLGPGILSPKVG